MKRTARTLALFALALAAVLFWRALDEPDRAGSLAPEGSATSTAAAGTSAGADHGTAPADDPDAREAVGAEAASEAPRVTHVVRGRVVDERRFPVEGATVSMHGAQLPHVEPVRSGEDGAFVFELALPEGRAVHGAGVGARSGDRAAASALYLREAEADDVRERELGALVLLAAHPLTVRVVADGAPVAGARVIAHVGNSRVPAASAQSDARGAARFLLLPEGPVNLVARTDARAGRGEAWIPRDSETTVRLCDGTGAAVLVVDAESGAPVEGARVRAQERSIAPMALRTDPDVLQRVTSEHVAVGANAPIEDDTDAGGRAVLRGLVPGGTYRVEVQAEGYRVLNRPPNPLPKLELACEGPEEPLRIELRSHPERSLRWPVVGGEVPRPPDGTRFTVRFAPGSVRAADERPLLDVDARMEGTDLMMDAAPARGALIVEASDGALARAWIPRDDDVSVPGNENVGDEIAFRRPRAIEVVLRDTEGEPSPDVWIGAVNGGNNAVCAPVLTDSEGRAVLDGLYGRSVEVRVVRGPSGGRTGSTLGTVDLEAGDGRIVATWPLPEPERTRVRLRVLLDGVAQLPGRFRLGRAHAAEVVEEFPARGELLVELDCSGEESVQLSLVTVDHGSATVDVPCRSAGAEPVVTVELEALGTLVARVVPPAEGGVSILPQRRNPETGEWGRPRELFILGGLRWANGPDGAFVFHGLESGRYRVTDTRSSIVSDAVELPPGGRRVEVSLDLSEDAWVEGRVELPDPRWMSDVRILVGDQRPPADPIEEWIDASRWERAEEGRFRVRVPVGEETVVRPWHPWLRPAADGGVHVAHGAEDGVVLRLVEVDGLVLPVEPMPPTDASVRVARYTAGTAPSGAPLEWHRFDVDGDALRGSVPAGTWTLFADVDVDGAYAPLVLEDVAVDGVTELPRRTLDRGGSVRVRVLLAGGSDPTEVFVQAIALDEPVHRRYVSETGTEVVLTGLTAGRYRVRMSRAGSFGDGVEREIESDGVGETRLELDLR